MTLDPEKILELFRAHVIARPVGKGS